MKSLILSCLMALCAVSMWAQSNQKCGDNVFFEFSEDGTLTISGFGNVYTDCKTFRHSDLIEKVVVKYGVTDISEFMFAECKNLKSVELANSVKLIGSGAFTACASLESLKLPETLDEIPSYMCQNCPNLKSLTIPETVTVIRECAFKGTGLESVVIPNSVTEIDQLSFYECSNLKSFVFPESLKSLGDYVFGYCGKLSDVTLPKDLKSIPARLFYECSSLKSVKIPETVTEIRSYAFYKSGLEEIELPVGLQSIEFYAFEYTKLKTITLPYTLKEVDDNALCSSLTSVVSMCPIPPKAIGEYGEISSNPHECELHVPAGSYNKYKNELGWQDFGKIIDDVVPLSCATPTITIDEYGYLNFSCDTKDVYYYCSVNMDSKKFSGKTSKAAPQFDIDHTCTITVYAVHEALGYSQPATYTINFSDLSDADGDGIVTINDITNMIDKYLAQ